MRILITGAYGFVGRHVQKTLRREHEIFTPVKAEVNCLDLSELKRYCCDNDIEVIVHLAALCGGIGANEAEPGRFFYQNAQMGLNVLEAARLTGVVKVINVGTVCSYPKYTPIPFKEKDLWNGYPEETNAPYGIAKKSVMEMGIAYHKQYGLQVVNLVPVNMSGEYDNFNPQTSHVIPAIIRKFAESDGESITLWGDGSPTREFLYAGDFAEAVAICCNSATYPGPQPINLGTGIEYSIKYVANKIKEVGGYSDISIKWDTSRPNGQPRRCLDTSRASELLGWSATTTLSQQITQILSWLNYEGVL